MPQYPCIANLNHQQQIPCQPNNLMELHKNLVTTSMKHNNRDPTVHLWRLYISKGWRCMLMSKSVCVGTCTFIWSQLKSSLFICEEDYSGSGRVCWWVRGSSHCGLAELSEVHWSILITTVRVCVCHSDNISIWALCTILLTSSVIHMVFGEDKDNLNVLI